MRDISPIILSHILSADSFSLKILTKGVLLQLVQTLQRSVSGYNFIYENNDEN